MVEQRIGFGNDFHVLLEGDGIVLGGVRVPCDRSARAVSDGDVVLHALVDALLGAVGLGDIGDHFPESAVKKGEDSRRFVESVLALPELSAARIVNVDCVIELERPRLSTWKASIRRNIAAILRIDETRVNVKAKTSEGMGPVGVGEAVTASVVALLKLPSAEAAPDVSR